MRSVLSVCLVLALVPALAEAAETEWNVATGTWDVGDNWTAGVPTVGCLAMVPTGSATINQAGATCADLHVIGAPPVLPFVQMQGTATLTVPGSVVLDGATMSQFAGTATYGTLRCGGDRTGGYALGGGSLTVDRCVLGSGNRTGSLSMASGNLTVHDSLIVNRVGAITLSGFQANSSLGDVAMRGIFAVANGSRPILAESFIMEGTPRLHAAFGPGPVSVITVSGNATLAGTLMVLDANNAILDGTYEFLRAANLDGEFTATDFPSEDWTWFTEGNSLYLRKGDLSPALPASWSGIKAGRP